MKDSQLGDAASHVFLNGTRVLILNKYCTCICTCLQTWNDGRGLQQGSPACMGSQYSGGQPCGPQYLQSRAPSGSTGPRWHPSECDIDSHAAHRGALRALLRAWETRLSPHGTDQVSGERLSYPSRGHAPIWGAEPLEGVCGSTWGEIKNLHFHELRNSGGWPSRRTHSPPSGGLLSWPPRCPGCPSAAPTPTSVSFQGGSKCPRSPHTASAKLVTRVRRIRVDFGKFLWLPRYQKTKQKSSCEGKMFMFGFILKECFPNFCLTWFVFF